MTWDRAHADLVSAVEELWAAVSELVLITLEDAPRPADLAVLDDWVESVSGLQGDVAGGRETLGAAAPISAARLLQLQRQLDEATFRYWQAIRAYEPVAELRRAARSRSREWTAWAGSVQRSAVRCETPLRAALAACRATWDELIQASSTEIPSSTNDVRRRP